ncbi:MAG: 4-hydroxyphenylacetate 3-hydroxylase [Rhodospirillaceae bacterium]|nr:4-hydroxyphenylacetate 3-hydroxylase [Rhodospirillaceae bacterium]MBT5037358.1 4-hydroxyphenylacetate 3-hydroxylase [Rhodospirillaceae bacterium]
MLLSGGEYRESLRRYKPTVYLDGALVESVADEPRLAPGVAAVGETYNFAKDTRHRPLMVATEQSSGAEANRFLHINRSSEDLLHKLEAVRLVCQRVGCAQRYLSQDALNAIYQATHRIDAETGGELHQRFLAYLHRVQAEDLTLGAAMTDAKGDRSKRPHEQSNSGAYVHIRERRADGIVISGTKAIVTGAPYMHELLVMPGRNMVEADADFAVCCAVPIDAKGLTVITRPAGRPGEDAAIFSGRYGQSTGVCVFEDVFVPWQCVFMAGEWQHAQFLIQAYAGHHRHSCIGARAGFGDLLIGAALMMAEANGLDAGRNNNLRERMVELIKIVEGFFACGVASSTYAVADASGCAEPERIFANVGKLLLSTQIYDMQRIAHDLSGGLIVALPGPAEDHNPATAAKLEELWQGRDEIPAERRRDVARFLGDITASDTAGWYSLISLHGGGSPAATSMEIYRSYPLEDKVALVEGLLDRGLMAEQGEGSDQPGRCCDDGCQAPEKEKDGA